ncbi:MAG: hypothetical protein MJ174_07375 [Treponema sp.]|nr:hypothetical protein [Treponema sp.]
MYKGLMRIDEWNALLKPDECAVFAEDGDLIYLSGGIIYLIQRKDNINNVVCFRVYEVPKMTVKQSFYAFRRFCIKNEVQYIRVEGNRKRYFFLKHFEKGLKAKGYNVRFAEKESEERKRNVFYIKLYD